MPAHTLYNWNDSFKILTMSELTQNKDFAILVGKAFLRELEAGRKDAAIAFGRAFLLTLGMKGLEERSKNTVGQGKPLDEHPIAA